MAEPDLDLRQNYLKEQQDYQDAVSAYEQTLNRVASSLPVPVATQSNYSVASGGYQRAATDPWISQRYPELAEASRRLAKEESEYRAIDDPSANHANNKCSIASYVGDKFYEYVAMAEMLYKIATDESFRNKLLAELKESAEHGFLNDLMAMSALGHLEQAKVFARTEDDREAIQKAIDGSRAAADRMASRLKSYFIDKWEEFKRGYEECGLLNAVAKAGIDGVFFLGEIAVGGVLAKGLKLSYRLTKSGLHRVEVLAVGRTKSIGAFEWRTDALEAKYGHPAENQVAGILEDKNRAIPDEPAEALESRRKRRKRNDERPDGTYRDPADPEGVRRNEDGEAVLQDPKTGKWLPISQSASSVKGKFGETIADRYMASQGYEKVNGPLSEVTDAGHNGIDGVYRKSGNPPSYVIADSKYGTAGLGTLKDGTKQMSPAWVRGRLEDAVGEEEAFLINLHGYEPKILQIDKYGNVKEKSLDNKKWREEDR